MKFPRGLSVEEQAAWAHLASSVDPLDGRERPKLPVNAAAAASPPPPPKSKKSVTSPRMVPVPARPVTPRKIGHTSLDSHWDRKLKSGAIAPDYTLDLHDHYLDAAHDRLESGLSQARAMEARLVLVITGRPRPVEAADRGSKRGVIRAKLLDWLAAGSHADAIAAIRKAHRKHGGEGAVYVVLRRER
ncbi:Smr/MutS family protein [Pontixanthobacter sp.]|uniref:Smr/MutS family protein n=1 Tax=Pontixanthobacter sp. TaxID=2792078 RepID=UPI003C7B96CD